MHADTESLLALRTGTGWTPAERRELDALARRMAELREINRRLDSEGLIVVTMTGRVLNNPLAAARTAAERAIRRARTDLGLNVSIGEARRQGGRQAEAGGEYGQLGDGSWTPTLAFALDADELRARPEGHDFAAEQALYWKLCEAGEITPDGEPIPGGLLWRDMQRNGSPAR